MAPVVWLSLVWALLAVGQAQRRVVGKFSVVFSFLFTCIYDYALAHL
jgi:hypothetical protein